MRGRARSCPVFALARGRQDDTTGEYKKHLYKAEDFVSASRIQSAPYVLTIEDPTCRALSPSPCSSRALENDAVELDEAVVIAFDGFLIDGLVRTVGDASEFHKAWRAADRRLSLKSARCL